MSIKHLTNFRDRSDEEFFQAVDDELRRLMEEQPIFQYHQEGDSPGCFYHEGPPNAPDRSAGCIFGQAFQRLGATKKSLSEIGGPIWSLIPGCPRYWSQIQYEQDYDTKWGDLLEFLPESRPKTTKIRLVVFSDGSTATLEEGETLKWEKEVVAELPLEIDGFFSGEHFDSL